MGDIFFQFRQQIQAFLSQLTTQQKIILFAGVGVLLTILLLVLVWTGGAQYEVLYAQLSQKDAGAILEKLRERNIDYKLRDGGSTILVPTDKVYELRLEFAREGLPENSVVGYEIFDKTNLGMTDFVQKLNYRRALEGELTRTIEQLDAIEKARVHIVIPERTLFREDQKVPTASVIVKLKKGRQLNPGNLQGIAYLLASSVEGLEPENVTILDTRGRVLSNNQSPEDLITMSATQLEFTKKVEDYLTQKAQSMLDQVLGPGNAIVRVSAELNFTQVEKTIEEFDPDNTVVRSEEIVEQLTPMTGEGSAQATTNVPASRSTNTITNYEINKTLQHIVENVGNITRLSVAVLVNNKREKVVTPDGEEKIEFKPRDPQELNTLADLVKKAVGFQEERNDQISITSVDFSIPSLEEELLNVDDGSPWSDYYNIIEKVFIILAIVASMLIMRSLFNQVKQRNEELQAQIKILTGETDLPQLPPGEQLAPAGQLPSGQSEQLPAKDDEFIRADQFFEEFGQPKELNMRIRKYIKEHPDLALNLLKLWMVEDE
ncbi:MAG: flagellar M-ring protein FliF [Calditrichaeota bacterium]|nr:flagellar M-ring protein FliF [Calditrichota bacterium]